MESKNHFVKSKHKTDALGKYSLILGPKILFRLKEESSSNYNKGKSKSKNMLFTEKLSKNTNNTNDIIGSLLKGTMMKQKSTINKITNITEKVKLKLPKDLDTIDNDKKLSSLLLKNPEFMTVEEKNFIYSFNSEEKKIFYNYLKKKNLEKKWQGNGIGSGNYLDNFHTFYRDKSTYIFHKKNGLPLLKAYIKNLYDKDIAKIKNSVNEHTNKLNVSILIIKKNKSVSKNVLINDENLTIKYDNEIEDHQIKKEITLFSKLENFKMNVFKSKQALLENQLNQQNDLLNEMMDNNINQMRQDIKRMKNNQKLPKLSYTNDLTKSIKKYKSDLKNNKFVLLRTNNEILKIKEYKEKVSMTNLDLIRFLDETSFSSGKIDITLLEKGLIKHKILFENEAKSLIKTLKNYFKDDFILNEAFEEILNDENTFYKELNQNSENDDDDSQVENEFLLAKLSEEYDKVKDFIELNKKGNADTLLHSHKVS